jgi:hypothetical protein
VLEQWVVDRQTEMEWLTSAFTEKNSCPIPKRIKYLKDGRHVMECDCPIHMENSLIANKQLKVNSRSLKVKTQLYYMKVIQ